MKLFSARLLEKVRQSVDSTWPRASKSPVASRMLIEFDEAITWTKLSGNYTLGNATLGVEGPYMEKEHRDSLGGLWYQPTTVRKLVPTVPEGGRKIWSESKDFEVELIPDGEAYKTCATPVIMMLNGKFFDFLPVLPTPMGQWHRFLVFLRATNGGKVYAKLEIAASYSHHSFRLFVPESPVLLKGFPKSEAELKPENDCICWACLRGEFCDDPECEGVCGREASGSTGRTRAQPKRPKPKKVAQKKRKPVSRGD